MTSKPGQQRIAIQTLINIPRSKGDQLMKFGLLIEYNLRKIIHKMWWRNNCQTLFYKTKIEHISGSILYKFI